MFPIAAKCKFLYNCEVPSHFRSKDQLVSLGLLSPWHLLDAGPNDGAKLCRL